MGVYTIRELENLSGIKAHTIRIWEKRYGLIAPQRSSTNIRSYCDSELKKLLNISILNRNGLKISKIAQLSASEIVDKINAFSQESNNADSQIEGLTVAMIDLDEYRFEQILAKSIIMFGFEDAVTRVLYPFFTRIGLMWQTGAVNPAQEHFITNLVKQKFFAAIDGLLGNERPGARRFVFFLPEGELHEIGLLFACYLARKRGFRTIYFGQSLPVSDLMEAVNNRQVDYLYTTLTSTFHGKDLEGYFHTLSNAFQDKIIFISGSLVHDFNGNLPPNIKLMTSPRMFLEEISRLQPEVLAAS